MELLIVPALVAILYLEQLAIGLFLWKSIEAFLQWGKERPMGAFAPLYERIQQVAIATWFIRTMQGILWILFALPTVATFWLLS